MRSRAVSRLVVLALATAMPVFADAPTSGPDKQYDSFVESDREISDLFTFLVWERPSTNAPYPAAMTYAEAVTYCANGGRRVPSLTELLSLVDETPHLEYETSGSSSSLVTHMIDQRAFPKTPADEFWTSSLRSDGSHYATVNFGNGTTASAQPGDSRRIRCVVALPPTP